MFFYWHKLRNKTVNKALKLPNFVPRLSLITCDRFLSSHAFRMVWMQVISSHATFRCSPQFDALSNNPLHHLILHMTSCVLFSWYLVAYGVIIAGLCVWATIFIHQNLPCKSVSHHKRNHNQQKTRRTHNDCKTHSNIMPINRETKTYKSAIGVFPRWI